MMIKSDLPCTYDTDKMLDAAAAAAAAAVSAANDGVVTSVSEWALHVEWRRTYSPLSAEAESRQQCYCSSIFTPRALRS